MRDAPTRTCENPAFTVAGQRPGTRAGLPDLRHRHRGGHGQTRRTGYDITGNEGLTLSQRWQGGPRTLHGFQTRGFPYCFFTGVTQRGFAASFPPMLNEQSHHIAYLIRQTLDSNATSIEPITAGETAGWRRPSSAWPCLPEFRRVDSVYERPHGRQESVQLPLLTGVPSSP